MKRQHARPFVRPEGPTPFEKLVAFVGLLVVAAMVVVVGWLFMVLLTTWGDALREVVR